MGIGHASLKRALSRNNSYWGSQAIKNGALSSSKFLYNSYWASQLSQKEHCAEASVLDNGCWASQTFQTRVLSRNKCFGQWLSGKPNVTKKSIVQKQVFWTMVMVMPKLPKKSIALKTPLRVSQDDRKSSQDTPQMLVKTAINNFTQLHTPLTTPQTTPNRPKTLPKRPRVGQQQVLWTMVIGQAKRFKQEHCSRTSHKCFEQWVLGMRA